MRWARTPHQGAGPASRREGRDADQFPCYAERRYGGAAEDELLLAMPPEEFVRGIEGLEGLGKSGFRYRIPPYGAHMDPSAGMSKSYQLWCT
jgi:hypothetical protein